MTENTAPTPGRAASGRRTRQVVFTVDTPGDITDDVLIGEFAEMYASDPKVRPGWWVSIPEIAGRNQLAALCGHEFSYGGVAYSCERMPHETDGYGSLFRHAAPIDAGHAEGTDEGDGHGEADLLTWGEDGPWPDGPGEGQDSSVAWGTIAEYIASDVTQLRAELKFNRDRHAARVAELEAALTQLREAVTALADEWGAEAADCHLLAGNSGPDDPSRLLWESGGELRDGHAAALRKLAGERQ
jgi:hypothetical protein